MTDALVLISKSLAEVVVFWRPGSHGNGWTWADEYDDLMTRDTRTPVILQRVFTEGIGFMDHVTPILLGSDGRVWDGHHRICIALKLGIARLDVEMAGG